ncbi:hypothetical protein CXG81DRAFT_20203 [Caulochytrium protostelioides]|uniref:Uncharacterized protein n=1 Tax=Caulochytrium protostelioides TaxID=1555241 RepID=A0A4P9X3Z2_9FUNG|nr:hypothetical protein CXG81DRAFT_20203 [Caulochytrium protostelioides]|eukprot:RKO99741.1 hypothetical protein CXG81DRAFT_20203 [Caulochytrium protostelioides]
MVSSDPFDPSQVDLDAILPEVDDVARVPILSNPLFVRQLINAILGQLTIAQLQLGIPERFHPWVRKMREPATDAQSKEYQSLVDKFVQDVDIAATHVLQHRDPFAPIVDPSVIIPTAPRDIGGRLMFYDKHDYNLPETILSRDDLDNDSYPSRPLELVDVVRSVPDLLSSPLLATSMSDICQPPAAVESEEDSFNFVLSLRPWPMSAVLDAPDVVTGFIPNVNAAAARTGSSLSSLPSFPPGRSYSTSDEPTKVTGNGESHLFWEQWKHSQ